MDYEAFKEIFSGVTVKNPVQFYMEYENRDDILMSKWEVGGEQRNAWGDGILVKGKDPEPADFENLEYVLEEVWPDITFLQFRKLCRALVKYAAYTDSDYYRRTEYEMKYVLVQELYKYLLKEGVFDDL